MMDFNFIDIKEQNSNISKDCIPNLMDKEENNEGPNYNIKSIPKDENIKGEEKEEELNQNKDISNYKEDKIH